MPLPSAPKGYDVRDQNEMRRQLQQALHDVTALETALQKLQAVVAALPVPGTGGFILFEDGVTRFLLEDGSGLILMEA